MLIGSLLSSSVEDRYVRPVITFVIWASGLKYIGLSTPTLGWTLCATLALASVAHLTISTPWRRASEPRDDDDPTLETTTTKAGASR